MYTFPHFSTKVTVYIIGKNWIELIMFRNQPNIAHPIFLFMINYFHYFFKCTWRLNFPHENQRDQSLMWTLSVKDHYIYYVATYHISKVWALIAVADKKIFIYKSKGNVWPLGWGQIWPLWQHLTIFVYDHYMVLHTYQISRAKDKTIF